MKTSRLAFLASHNGSSARAIVEACGKGALSAQPVLMISNNPESVALQWAKEKGLKTAAINKKTHEDVDQAIAELLRDDAIDLVVCSGYMRLIGPKTINSVSGKILNVHPALLPRYGGKGMYGRHVHQAVHDNKDKETGITIHLADGEYDHGRIVAQKIVPLADDASVEDIEAAVKDSEPDFYVETIARILRGDITL